MIWNKINLMVPTFGRATTNLPVLIKSVIETSDPSITFFTFMTNELDPASDAKIKELLEKTPFKFTTLHENLSRPNLAVFWNRMCEASTDKAAMVSMIGDDMIFKTPGWDKTIIKWCNIFNGVCVIFGDDCNIMHDALTVNIFTTRKMVDAIAPHPFMAEEFPIDYMDKVWDEAAKRINRRIYVDSVKIFHNHGSMPGASDETYRRLRERRTEADSKLPKFEEHVAARVERIKRNLADDLAHEDISVTMTTCDRPDHLRHTIASYDRTQGKPDILHVFDDASKEIDPGAAFREVDGAMVSVNKKRLGYNANTPESMKTLFDNGAKAVLVLDSDTAFCAHWWEAANSVYRRVKDLPQFGVLSLMNAANTPAEKTDIPGLVGKIEVGAFGTIYTKRFFDKYVWPQYTREPTRAWDVRASAAAADNGLDNYALSPSMLQHTGVSVGAHGGGISGAYAEDFGGNRKPLVILYKKDAATPIPYTVKHKRADSTALVSCCGRYGDIIHISLYVNQMIKNMGIAVDFITIPYYKSLACSVCPGAKVKVFGESPDLDWYSADTYRLSRDFPGYDTYINAQPGSPQHHGCIFGTGVAITDYMRTHFEESLGAELDRDLLKYREFNDDGIRPVEMQRNGKPLCIIAPEAISAKTMWSMSDLIEFYGRYSGEYDVKYIYKTMPQNTPKEVRRNIVNRISFVQAICVLKRAELFIGQDSGLAWASLYSNCHKIIYHRKSRMVDVLTRFSDIDSTIQEVVVDNL